MLGVHLKREISSQRELLLVSGVVDMLASLASQLLIYIMTH